MLRRRARGPSLELLAIASFMLVGSAADAGQVYTLSGKFVSNQSGVFNFPLVGDVACPSIVIQEHAGGPPGTAGYTPPIVPANPAGCVPGKAKLTTTGKGVGGAFVMPKQVFAQLPQSSNGLPAHWLPVTVQPVGGPRQISTSIGFSGPPGGHALPQGSMADGMNNAVFRDFRADAWTMQSGRIGADFTWCARGSCSGGQIVRYHTRGNRFGGTMGLIMVQGPNGSKMAVQNGVIGGGITFFPLPTSGTRPTGVGYAVKRSSPALKGSAWAMYMTAMVPGRPTPRITMGTTYLGPRSGFARVYYGFPFTTGTVVARNFGSLGTTTLTARGGDTVTAMGARNISLVAGGVAYAPIPFDTGSPNITQVMLPEPGAAGLLAGTAALLWIAASRATRSQR